MVMQIKDKLGRPIRDLRISVTDRCNFRCDYCMPKKKYLVTILSFYLKMNYLHLKKLNVLLKYMPNWV